MIPASMHSEIHLIVAISLSMILTFGLHCTMKDVPPRDSAFQRVLVDFVRDSMLLMRCSDYDRRSDQICSAYFLPEDKTDMHLISIVLSITFVLTLCGSMRVLNYFCHVAVFLVTVDWLGRYLDYLEISDQIDFITVYFVVWQFISVPWTWMWQRLPSPILLIKQASLCIFMSAVAFGLHDYGFRYVPREVSLALLWIIAVMDTFLCLHRRGWLRILSCREAKLGIPLGYVDPYYTGIGGEREGASLGLGDFLAYNLMILLALPPSLSSLMVLQLCTAAGAMISIEIGYLATVWIQWVRQISVVPGVPLPVVSCTTYVLLLDVIQNNPIPCATI